MRWPSLDPWARSTCRSHSFSRMTLVGPATSTPHCRRYGALGSPAARQWYIRGTPHRLARGTGLHPHAEGRDDRQGVLRAGLGHPADAERHTVWHNGGTAAFGAYVGMVLDKNIGVIVLTNETNVGVPDAIGRWTLDLMLGDQPKSIMSLMMLKGAEANFRTAAKLFAKPAAPGRSRRSLHCTGTFANPSFGRAVVGPEGDRLVMELQATGAKLKLSLGTAMSSRPSSCRSAGLRLWSTIWVPAERHSSSSRSTRAPGRRTPPHLR